MTDVSVILPKFYFKVKVSGSKRLMVWFRILQRIFYYYTYIVVERWLKKLLTIFIWNVVNKLHLFWHRTLMTTSCLASINLQRQYIFKVTFMVAKTSDKINDHWNTTSVFRFLVIHAWRATSGFPGDQWLQTMPK